MVCDSNHIGIRETIIANSDSYTIYFPESWKNKTVTIVYDTEEAALEKLPTSKNVNKASELFLPFAVSLTQNPH